MAVRILVVDDEPDLESLIRQKFRKKIRSNEFEFFFAQNGAEALSCLDANRDIEVLLTDLNMPVMDGLTLLENLAARAEPLKAVVISAYGDIDNIRTAMNRGAFDFLTKPIDFNDLELTIDKTIKEVESMKAGQEAQRNLLTMRREMELAAQIQQSILPKTFPPFPERTDLDIHAAMTPAQSVGGDFYDFYLLDEHRLAFMIGDVSGKGMAAALFMAMSRSLLKATALTGVGPGECLSHVNDLICRDNASGMFVTLFYGILDTRSGELRYSNAGHNPPVLLCGGDCLRELENLGGLVLGVISDQHYQDKAVGLARGDGVFLYTDGVTDATSPEREFFGESRLLERLRELSQAHAAELTSGVMASLHAFARNAPQHDDITMLAVRYLE